MKKILAKIALLFFLVRQETENTTLKTLQTWWMMQSEMNEEKDRCAWCHRKRKRSKLHHYPLTDTYTCAVYSKNTNAIGWLHDAKCLRIHARKQRKNKAPLETT